ncbi:MAG TPA: amino acid permease [Solirubrobacteraceae bacterium]|jgi:amino acid transporter|nr:amino acid permease [Solirubrobacteraceae bacterium]
MTTTSDSQPAPGLFTRKATGLVREARTTDALFYNVMWASVALAFAFYWLLYGFAYQGSNAWVAFLIAACLGVPGAFLYAMLAQIMPRTGGDYVFNSRSLHPSVGFAGNFSYCVWLAVIYGVYTTYLATYGFGAFGRMMAGFTGSHAWLDFGDWFSKDYALFITGTVMLLLSAAVFIVGGLHLFLRLQVVAFALYVLGAFLLPVIVAVFQSKAGFLGNFQDYAANLGTQNATGALAASAHKAGFAPTGFDTETTLKSVSVFWYIFGFLYSSNYFAGEIRLRKRTHLVSIPGALAVSVVGIALLMLAYQGVTGYTFNGRLGFADPAAYGFAAGAPAYPEVMAIASGSWVFGAVMIAGFAVGLLIWLPQTMLLISRSMFSWSFDRIMPARLSYVDARTRSPVIAIAIVTVLAIGSTAIYAFTTWFTAISVLLGLSLTLLVTAVGGIVLPFRQRAMVENSPYGRRIAGIPIVSLVGAVSLIGFALAVAVILWDPGSGASLSANPGKLWLALGIYALAFVIYFVSRAVRRSQGIDLSLTYRELPPE